MYLPDTVENRCAHHPEEAELLGTVGALPLIRAWGGRRREWWKKVSWLQHDVFVILVTEVTVIEKNSQRVPQNLRETLINKVFSKLFFCAVSDYSTKYQYIVQRVIATSGKSH